MEEYVYSLDVVVDHFFLSSTSISFPTFNSFCPTSISGPVNHHQWPSSLSLFQSSLCLSFWIRRRMPHCVLGLGFVKYLKWVVPCWKPVTVLDDYFSSLYIILRGSVSRGNSSSRLSLCNFDHYSFIFCEPGTGGKLLHSMIYDIPSQQRMKNKLDFPTPFPHQHPITTTTTTTITALPSSYHTCFSPVCTWWLSS